MQLRINVIQFWASIVPMMSMIKWQCHSCYCYNFCYYHHFLLSLLLLFSCAVLMNTPGLRDSVVMRVFVRRAGLLWSQQDFEWRWSVPLFKCLTVLEFSFILFDLCLLITFFNFIMNYVPIVTFWIFTYHKIWILSIMFCSIWSYWIIYFLTCLEVSWRVWVNWCLFAVALANKVKIGLAF